MCCVDISWLGLESLYTKIDLRNSKSGEFFTRHNNIDVLMQTVNSRIKQCRMAFADVPFSGLIRFINTHVQSYKIHETPTYQHTLSQLHSLHCQFGEFRRDFVVHSIRFFVFIVFDFIIMQMQSALISYIY